MSHIWKFIFLLFASAQLQAQSTDKFYKMYDGNIAGMPAQLHLIRDANILTGHYYYIDHGILVNVDGNVDELGIFRMKEWSYMEQLDGVFAGITDSTFTKLAGTWFNADSTVQISFLFDEIQPQVKFKITSNVGDDETSNCYRKLVSYSSARMEKPHAEACLCCESVVFNNNDLFSTKRAETHLDRKIEYGVYNLNAEKLNLDNFFEKKYKKAITKEAGKVLRFKYEIPKIKSLKKKGFYKRKIEPNNNFYITPKAMVFVYNAGEIAPAEMGVIEVWIGFSHLQKFIKKDGALTWALE